jgi:predicted DNA-binding protein
MKTKRFGETLPVRIPEAVNARLKVIAKQTGLSRSDIMRLAIAHGLPSVEANRLPGKVA